MKQASHVLYNEQSVGDSGRGGEGQGGIVGKESTTYCKVWNERLWREVVHRGMEWQELCWTNLRILVGFVEQIKFRKLPEIVHPLTYIHKMARYVELA